MVYDNENLNTENDNVLKYIYKLKEHLENMTLLWQGLARTPQNKIIRITDPVAPDDFIYSQINGLASVLSPHNFVSQIKEETEKKNLILDTFTAFLQSIEKEEFFNWEKFDMVTEGYYNTLHLFLNAVEGGFGAQFTIAAQSGITSKIPVNNKEVEKVPYMDVPGIFGFNKETEQQKTPNNNKAQEEERGFYDARDDY